MRPGAAQRRLALARHDLDRDVLQLLRLDDVAVEAGFLERAAVGDGEQLAVIDHRHVELGAVLPVDLGLVDLDVGLAQRAGRARSCRRRGRRPTRRCS